MVNTLPKGAVYARYADDWVLALTCTATEAKGIKNKIAEFILTQRKMQLDTDKTKITYISEGFKFLGFDITRLRNNKQKLVAMRSGNNYYRILQRTLSHRFLITPDADRIIKRLKLQRMCDKNGKPMANPKWVGSSEYEIVTKYNQILRGIFNYYEPCGKFLKLYRISYILHYLCARTIARRKKITLEKVFSMYGKNLTIKVDRTEKNKSLSVTFQNLPRLRKILAKKPKKKYLNVMPTRYDPFRIVDHWRTKIKIFVECCICGEQNNVALYRNNLIRNEEKIKRLQSTLVRINRIQIPVCISCYDDIISGKYSEKDVEFHSDFIAKL